MFIARDRQTPFSSVWSGIWHIPLHTELGRNTHPASINIPLRWSEEAAVPSRLLPPGRQRNESEDNDARNQGI
jgi:hypothetical protein